MSTAPLPAVLHAVRAVKALTAAEAVAWFTSVVAPTAAGVVGYTLSARAATWVRVAPDATVEHVADGDVLDETYEMLLFDGQRELRWLRTPNGRGQAAALGEDPATLPPGDDVTADPPPRRGDTQTRLLAGAPRAHPRPGWTTLSSERYAAAYLPWPLTAGAVPTIETVEYLVEDEHGNVDVVDTRTVGLRTTSPEETTVVTSNSPGRTPR